MEDRVMSDERQLAEIIRKFVVVPWEIKSSSEEIASRWREIASDVAHMCGAGTAYLESPKKGAEFNFLHPGAIAIILAYEHSGRRVIRDKVKEDNDRQLWLGISAEEKDVLLSGLGVDCGEDGHESMLVLCKSARGVPKIASHIAVAFSVSTYVKSRVVPFSELARLAFTPDREDDALFRDIVQCGLLVIMGTGSGNRAGADRIYGFVRETLDEKVMRGDSYVFVDATEEEVLSAMLSGRLIHREQVEAMYREIFPASLRMGRLLYGPSVYISPLAVQEASCRERGQAVTV
jgi:hypothetical protein